MDPKTTKDPQHCNNRGQFVLQNLTKKPVSNFKSTTLPKDSLGSPAPSLMFTHFYQVFFAW